MKLHAENVLALEHRRVGDVVLADRGSGIVQWRVITVREIKIWARREIREQLRAIARLNFVPSHVRHAGGGWKAKDPAFKETEPLSIRRFLARLEQSLQAKTDPQEGNTGVNAFEQRIANLHLIERAHHLSKMADARKNDFISFAQRGCIADQLILGTDPGERVLD